MVSKKNCKILKQNRVSQGGEKQKPKPVSEPGPEPDQEPEPCPLNWIRNKPPNWLPHYKGILSNSGLEPDHGLIN